MAAASLAASAAPIAIDFEVVVPHDASANGVPIGSNYSGIGVEFMAGINFTCLTTQAVDCSAAAKGTGGSAGSELTAAYFDTNAPSVINLAAGFSDRFAMAYAHPFGGFGIAVGLEIWSGLDGSGTLLASINAIPGTPDNVDGHCDSQ